MKILAIPYGNHIRKNLYRDGLGVFARLFAVAMIENYDDISLEIWCYHNNLDYAKQLFEDIITRYPERISFLDEISYSQNSIVGRIYRSYYRALCIIGIKDSRRIPIHLDKKYFPYPEFLRRFFFHKMLRRESAADWVFNYYSGIDPHPSFDKPNILQIHDLFTMTYRDEFAQMIADIDGFNRGHLERINTFLTMNSLIVCSSDFTKITQCLQYVPGIRDEQVRVIPIVPMIKRFDDRMDVDREGFLRKKGIEGPYVFYPTQNRPNKNIITILKALDKLKKGGRRVLFVCTGKMSDLKECISFIHDNGLEDCIVEIGSVSEQELYSLYKYSSMLVSTSYIEGYGISGQVLEALVVGDVPVASAINDGVDECLRSHGLSRATADLNWFDRFDYKTLSHIIVDVLDNRQAHVEKQEGVVKLFLSRTWKDVARDYRALFEELERNAVR